MNPQELKALKEYVFALYIGSKVTQDGKSWILTIDDSADDYDEHTHFKLSSAIGYKCALLLRPLSSITDDEAIEVAKILIPHQLWKVSANNNLYARCVSNNALELAICKRSCYISIFDHAGMIADKKVLTPILLLSAYQYLQQQSFVLPVFFKGTLYSVEQLVELGIIKLKD